MADLPIAPGEIYIEVEYDYEYKAKDRLITIREGECYMLVKKANEDWWQVRKDEATKPFYVPAQYVREVRKALMPPPKPIPHSGNAHPRSGAKKPTNLDLGPAENLNRQRSKSRRSPSAQTAPLGNSSPPMPRRNSHSRGPTTPTERDRSLPEILVQGGGPQAFQKEGSGTLPRSRARSPEMVRAPLDVDSTQLCDSAGEERRTNDSESGDELSSSSTELLQIETGHGHSESSVYTNLQELKISQASLPPLPSGSPLHVSGDWETYKDHGGRHYYYNRSTQERTWKPPRTRETSSGSSRENRHSTGESSEWLRHVDDQGRPYYYSADGSRSEWELPKYKLSPPQPSADALKSRSLDRRSVEPIVLTKWRHSAFVQEPNEKPSEKCGILNMTKITENGKKVRKNWTSSWTSLQGSMLLFTKQQGSGTSWFGGQSKPEITVDLRGGSVEWASKDKSSKKHVLELKTQQGTELLIQSENESTVNDWLRALQDAISTHAFDSDDSNGEEKSDSPDMEKHDKEKDKASKKTKSLKNAASVDASDNKKAKKKLKHFLTRRPTLQSVKDKGYIKDQMFGSTLSSVCQQENTTVPIFVKMCIEHVESNGLSIDGLYRVSGNLAIIQKLRFAVNHDEKVNLADGKWEDIHVTTGALKMFFRELPEPLFTYDKFNDFVSAIKILDYRQRVLAVKELVKQLPRPNHDTMQALFKHLRKVIEHGEENRMNTQSVAIVFGPTLLRPETETFNMAFNMVYQNQIVELILLEYENIFGR
ncbi:rho GTPase-activating protein 12 isoform X4 [Kryptolebias marmoratus]|uniref:Rho GTPase activating protein 12a n=1 Tax=Kryptolebias marmoratus TaxID=37003 RepID=A0A3Q3AZY9_KRYMA|nr:rho GTPase-activating protein 12 isoform X4 [Kryptolebias marmoratus]